MIDLRRLKKQLVPTFVSNAKRQLLDSNCRRTKREFSRIHALPRFEEGCTDLLGTEIVFTDGPSFVSMYYEIFVQKHYEFRVCRKDPRIIDAGANIGLSAIYFSRCYPDGRITAFEPDPYLFGVLQRNLNSANVQNVESHCEAVWTENCELSFDTDRALSGRLVSRPVESDKNIRVEAVDMRRYLTEPIDLMKFDIEGAELDVLEHCSDKLDSVDKLFVEYHSFIDKPQRVGDLFSILQDAGFRLQVKSIHPPKQPFMGLKNAGGMDMQLNIYGFRD